MIWKLARTKISQAHIKIYNFSVSVVYIGAIVGSSMAVLIIVGIIIVYIRRRDKKSESVRENLQFQIEDMRLLQLSTLRKLKDEYGKSLLDFEMADDDFKGSDIIINLLSFPLIACSSGGSEDVSAYWKNAGKRQLRGSSTC